MLAVQEFEKDVTVKRLLASVKKAMSTTTRTTYKGTPKVAGAMSVLEQAKPSKEIQKKIDKVGQKVRNGTWTLRRARNSLRLLLGRPGLGVSTAMRVLEKVRC